MAVRVKAPGSCGELAQGVVAGQQNDALIRAWKKILEEEG